MTVYMIWGYYNKTMSHRLVAAIEEERWNEDEDWVQDLYKELNELVKNGVYEDWRLMRWTVDDDEFDEEFCSDLFEEVQDE